MFIGFFTYTYTESHDIISDSNIEDYQSKTLDNYYNVDESINIAENYIKNHYEYNRLKGYDLVKIKEKETYDIECFSKDCYQYIFQFKTKLDETFNINIYIDNYNVQKIKYEKIN